MSESKTYCSAVDYSIVVKDNAKTYMPCCDILSNEVRKQQHTSIDDYFQNNILRQQVKNDMQKGIWHSACERCKRNEEIGVVSSRQKFNNNIVHKKGIEYLEYRPSNFCNLKCRMCSPFDSHMIAKEELAFTNGPFNKLGTDVLTDMSNPYDNKAPLLDISKLTELKEIKVLGGEPSVDAKLHDWLIDLDKTGRAKELRLNLTSNFTNLNEKWCDILSKFSHVEITASLDGAGNTYEYIRTPANWNAVKTNVLNAYNKIDSLKRLRINFVLSLYNCFTIKDWYLDLKPILELVDKVNLMPSMSTSCPSSNDLDNEFKDIVKQDVESLINEYGDTKDFLQTILNITMRNSQFDQDKIKNFFKYSERYDLARNTNLYDLSEKYGQLKSKYV